MQLLAPLFAGLGLFFFGIHLLSRNLTPLIGERLRTLLARLVRTRLLAGIAGAAAGFLTQSVDAVSFIAIGLVNAGIVEKKKALLFPTWAGLGSAGLVLIAAIDFKIAASYLIGITASVIYFSLSRSDNVRKAANLLLGLGLIFIGLDTLKANALPMLDVLLSSGILAIARTSPILLFLLGFCLTAVCYSGIIVGAITVAAVAAGVLPVEGAIGMVLGANLGSAFNAVLLARTMQGEAAQIVVMQVVQKIAGFVLVAAVIVVNWQTQTPLFFEFDKVVHEDARRIAAIFAAYQVLGSAFCTIFLDPIARLLERISPPSALHEMSRPMYLVSEALVDPKFAIELVGREEQRVLQRLPLMLDEIRSDVEGEIQTAELTRNSSASVLAAMAAYSGEILAANLSRTDRERVVRSEHRISNLSALFESLLEFVTTCKEARDVPVGARVAHQMIESLHSLLQSVVDAAASGDESDFNIVLQLLGSRDEIMDRIRKRVMNDDPDMPASLHSALFTATMLFARVVWLLRQNALLLMPERNSQTAEVRQPVRQAVT